MDTGGNLQNGQKCCHKFHTPDALKKTFDKLLKMRNKQLLNEMADWMSSRIDVSKQFTDKTTPDVEHQNEPVGVNSRLVPGEMESGYYSTDKSDDFDSSFTCTGVRRTSTNETTSPDPELGSSKPLATSVQHLHCKCGNSFRLTMTVSDCVHNDPTETLVKKNQFQDYQYPNNQDDDDDDCGDAVLKPSSHHTWTIEPTHGSYQDATNPIRPESPASSSVNGSCMNDKLSPQPTPTSEPSPSPHLRSTNKRKSQNPVRLRQPDDCVGVKRPYSEKTSSICDGAIQRSPACSRSSCSHNAESAINHNDHMQSSPRRNQSSKCSRCRSTTPDVPHLNDAQLVYNQTRCSSDNIRPSNYEQRPRRQLTLQSCGDQLKDVESGQDDPPGTNLCRFPTPDISPAQQRPQPSPDQGSYADGSEGVYSDWETIGNGDFVYGGVTSSIYQHNLRVFEQDGLNPSKVTKFGLPKLSESMVEFVTEDGKKQFRCPLCFNNYANRSGLNRHYVTHSSDDMWKAECNICGKKYSRKDSLKHHVKTQHNDDVRNRGAANRRSSCHSAHVSCHQLPSPSDRTAVLRQSSEAQSTSAFHLHHQQQHHSKTNKPNIIDDLPPYHRDPPSKKPKLEPVSIDLKHHRITTDDSRPGHFSSFFNEGPIIMTYPVETTGNSFATCKSVQPDRDRNVPCHGNSAVVVRSPERDAHFTDSYQDNDKMVLDDNHPEN